MRKAVRIFIAVTNAATWAMLAAFVVLASVGWHDAALYALVGMTAAGLPSAIADRRFFARMHP